MLAVRKQILQLIWKQMWPNNPPRMHFSCSQLWNAHLSSKIGVNFNCVQVISIQSIFSACFYIIYKCPKTNNVAVDYIIQALLTSVQFRHFFFQAEFLGLWEDITKLWGNFAFFTINKHIISTFPLQGDFIALRWKTSHSPEFITGTDQLQTKI